MASTYRMSRAPPWLINSLFRIFPRLVWGPRYLHTLTVKGRKTGRLDLDAGRTLAKSMASGGSSRLTDRQAGSRTPALRARSRSAAAGTLSSSRSRRLLHDGRSPSASELHH